MRIRAGYFRESEMPRDLECEDVLVLAAGAVEHFDRIDHLEDFELGGAVGIARIDWLGVGIDKREARVELVAKRMIRDQNPAFEVHDSPEFGELVDSADITLEPERADMAHVGGD